MRTGNSPICAGAALLIGCSLHAARAIDPTLLESLKWENLAGSNVKCFLVYTPGHDLLHDTLNQLEDKFPFLLDCWMDEWRWVR